MKVKKLVKGAIWTIVIAVFVLTFVFLFMNSRKEKPEFEITEPLTTTIEKSTVLTGTIEPRDEISIKPQISGIISEIMVEAGETVKEGDIIARIKVVPDESQLSAAAARIRSAEIMLRDARTRHERNSVLYDKKVISREEWESTQKDLDQATEELRSARDAYAIVKEGVSPDNASGSNTLVRATTSGLVLDVPVKVGASVIQANTFNDGTTIATVADMSDLIFLGKVDETEVGSLKIGQPVDITIGAAPDVSIHATIEFISPKSTATSGANTYEIKAGMKVPEGITVRSGYSANAAVELQKAADILAVPERVVEFVGDSTFVYVLTDSATQQFTRRAISTGLSDGINIQVTGGLKGGERLRGPQIQK